MIRRLLTVLLLALIALVILWFARTREEIPAGPREVQTRTLGVLVRTDFGYEPEVRPTLDGAHLDSVVVWVPAEGIGDPAAFAAEVDRVYTALTTMAPTLAREYPGALAQAYHEGTQGEPCSTKPEDMVKLSALTGIHLNLTGSWELNTHELFFSGTAPIIENDFILEFGKDLKPSGFHFDG